MGLKKIAPPDQDFMEKYRPQLATAGAIILVIIITAIALLIYNG